MNRSFHSFDTPFGTFTVLEEQGRLTALMYGNTAPKDANPCRTPLLGEAEEQLMTYFAGRLQNFELPIALQGTPFQQKCWSALMQIPYGETRTYAQQANMIGSPKAARAVGMANHRNPLPIIVPCHRVVGANGKLTGYTGGLWLKQQLLLLEAKHMK